MTETPHLNDIEIKYWRIKNFAAHNGDSDQIAEILLYCLWLTLFQIGSGVGVRVDPASCISNFFRLLRK